ncbi:2-oxoglutarate and Fe(II)-dependent oxygenase superfamily protein isoform 3 [Theobroma cacao]|uniref:2-oxoglutarate and Fe(II)-dependent oxygenase superfamily protein isoform 3 n=1 Tax=Theobroma cacao TaxID=3641 RepID=A0A061G518_THECC|nr:2-oxoglutarate and Fe(II)-dependent oxygenase superfamily protein isoform 3 [Theobroma cacao]
MSEALQLPIVDLSSPDCISTANAIRQACMDHGFFYLVNHEVEEELLKEVFEQSSKFFSLPVEEKMKLAKKNHRGYTAPYAEKLDTSLNTKGDSKESFYIGPLADNLNQWPLEEDLPSWRSTMETYHKKVLCAGTRLISLIALALKLDEDFFEKVGALNEPLAFSRMLHYPGDLDSSSEEIYGASAHSDYGMITLLVTDGVPGLQQVCREKSKKPQVWEDVPSMNGAFIVNIGDMMERWTNCLFRSTLHRVLPPGQERYSVAFFINPNKDCIVECLESCCSESCPPRFLPIRCLDYLEERLRLTYGS